MKGTDTDDVGLSGVLRYMAGGNGKSTHGLVGNDKRYESSMEITHLVVGKSPMDLFFFTAVVMLLIGCFFFQRCFIFTPKFWGFMIQY